MDAVNLTIERLDGTAAAAAADELAALLCDAVDGGASVGYLRPLDRAVARAWADDVAAEVAEGRTILLAARRSGRLCGSVQLQRASSPNGAHRAEVAKLLVHRAARRRGAGTRLMEAAQAAARADGFRTLVLDTEAGSEAERLYRRLGWTLVGTVPEYARSPEGDLRATAIYHRLL